MPYISGALGVALLMAMFALWISDKRLDRVREKLAVAEVSVQTAVEANNTLTGALTSCTGVNAENSAQREAAEQNAAAAEARIAELEIILAGAISVPVEKTDENCRELDEALPAGFIGQLCIDRSGNCG